MVLKLQPFQQFEQPAEQSIIITNPPYGERISTDDLLGLYAMIGERLKHAFTGNTAWILSYRDECFDQIGLKASRRIPLYNGALECEFREYEMFKGKYKEFREDGETLDKPEWKPVRRDDRRPRRDDDYRGRRDDDRRPRREFREDSKPSRERRFNSDERRPRYKDERPNRGNDRRREESYPERKRREAREREREERKGE